MKLGFIAAVIAAAVLPASTVPAQEVQAPEYAPVFCDILAKVAEPDPVFDSVRPAVGTKVHTYYETRRGKRKRYRRPEMEIALRILRLDTCTTEVVTITKRGNIPVSPEGWHIQVDVRHNGIQWNGVNSQFDVEEPEHSVVLANKVPDVRETFGTKTVRTADGKTKKIRVSSGWVVDDILTYSPYTVAAHRPDVVSSGEAYLQETVAWAFSDLRDRRVRMPGLGDRLIADTFPQEWIYRLPLAEQSDFGEFNINDSWKQWSLERVLVRIALNGERTNIYTCNYAGACGLFQVTDNGRFRKGKWRPGTYENLVKKFPEAGLIRDFKDGVRDHRNAAKAAILHHAMILEEHLKDYGAGILESPLLELTLAVGYNGGYGKSNRTAIRAAYTEKNSEKRGLWWRKLRKREAREYVIKLQFAVGFIPNGAALPEQS